MNDLERGSIATQEAPYVFHSMVHPSPFDLGSTYEGSNLEGSLLIAPAKQVLKVHIDKPNGLELLDLSPHWTGRSEVIWRCRVRTNCPGRFLGFVGFWTDLGKTSTHFSLEVKSGVAPGGSILFCESPFSAFSSEWINENLNILTRELQLQVNASHQLPEQLSRFDVVVLQRTGLRRLAQGAANILNRHLEEGGKLILLADHYSGSTVADANQLIEPHGIRLEDREYGEVLCDRSHIEDHRIASGVRRLRWFRPSPIAVKCSAKVLVHNPEQFDEGFLVCGGPNQNLFVVGCSRLDGFVCQGWPFDNGQLFANLLKRGRVVV